MEETFITEVEVNGRNMHNGKAKIKWCFTVELRGWGVKGFCVFVPDQTVEINYQYEDEEGDLIRASKSIELKDVEVDSSSLSFDEIVCPHDLDLRDGAIAVGF